MKISPLSWQNMHLMAHQFRWTLTSLLLGVCIVTLASGSSASADDSFHFRASVGNMGDTTPFYHNGQYHVFYLTCGAGKTSWDHIVSTDLVHWKELPRALTSDGAADGPDGGNMFTGCVIEKDGVFHLYYTGWNPRNPQGREWVMHATSSDVVTWTKHPEHGFRADGVQYLNRDFRDPYVFWNDQDEAWWMLLNTTDAKTDVAAPGLLRSEDLIHWKQLPPLVLDPPLPKGETGTPECPDLFRSGDYWYLLYTRHVQNIRRSKDILGPYRPCEPTTALDGSILLCGKRMFDGKRHVYVGPVGGSPYSVMCLPRELYAGPEGQLYQRPVDEATAVFAKTLLQLDKPRDVAAGFVLQTPDNYMLQCSVRIDPQATLAIHMREQPDPSGGYTLNLRPKSQEADLSGPGFRENRRCTLDTSKPIKIQAFVQDSVIECFVNDQFAVTCRAQNYPKGVLSFKVEGGQAEVLDLKVKVRSRVTPYRPANGLVGATAAPVPLQDKTLVAWVSPANLTQRGGSALTIDDGHGHFDGIVFGEYTAGKWMPGSDGFRRTLTDQETWPDETADGKTFVQIAIAYHDRQITIYRNGRQYAQYPMNNPPQEFGPQSAVLIGMRHLNQGADGRFAGAIDDARIYDRALSAEQIAALKPNVASDPKPWAWWTFDDQAAKERTGRFKAVKLVGGAKVADGKLLLDGKAGSMLAAPAPRLLPYRQANGSVGDTWYLQRDGLTHMFVLSGGGVGHATSSDLIHWEEQPMAVPKGPPGSYDEEDLWTGCTVEHSGTIYLYYCNNKIENGRKRQGMSLATSKDGGKTFTKYAGNPLFEPDPKQYFTINDPVPPFGYHARPMIDCRDLITVKDPAGDGWLGYVVMRRKSSDAYSSACIGLWHSKDLVRWESKGPCFTPNRHNCIEVPDVFKLGTHWYMLGLSGNGYGQSNRWSDPNIFQCTIVAMADQAQGPFEEVMDDFIVSASDNHCGPVRTVERNGERLALYTRGGATGNRVSLPLKLIERPGGGLTSVYWPGIDKAFGPALKAADVELQATDGWKAQALGGFPVDSRARMITASISFRGTEAAGLAFRHAGTTVTDPGYAVVLDAPAGEVALVKLPDFTPIQKRRWPVRQGGEHAIRIVVVENMFDVFIDNKLALPGSHSEIQAGGVSLLARKGAPRFSGIECRMEAE